MSFDERRDLFLEQDSLSMMAMCFAVTAAGYYGIIDLVGKRGVILQHGNSNRCQKGSKDSGSCS